MDVTDTISARKSNTCADNWGIAKCKSDALISGVLRFAQKTMIIKTQISAPTLEMK